MNEKAKDWHATALRAKPGERFRCVHKDGQMMTFAKGGNQGEAVVLHPIVDGVTRSETIAVPLESFEELTDFCPAL